MVSSEVVSCRDGTEAFRAVFHQSMQVSEVACHQGVQPFASVCWAHSPLGSALTGLQLRSVPL